jgi:diguanylate cyclase
VITDFLSHIAIITALLFFSSQLFKRYQSTPTSSVLVKVRVGLSSGIFGIIIMFFGVYIPPSGLLDLRHLFIIVAASLGGIYASVVSATVISLGRLLFFGGVNKTSLIAVSTLIVTGIIVGLIFEIKKPKGYWLKWSLSLLFITLSIWGCFFYLFDRETAILISTRLLPVFCGGGIFVAYLVDFLTKTNELFLKREQEATTDYLTRLHNVRTFDELFNNLGKQAAARNENLSLILIDIDYFKKINDTYGHLAGDFVLKELANLLKATARSFDIVSRHGGEEFTILLPDCPKSESNTIAERIRLTVEQHRFKLKDGTSLEVTISLGVANYPDVPIDDLIRRADQALYQAKRSGRNRVCVYVSGMENI